MNDENKSAVSALLDGISYLISDYIKNAPFDKTYTGIIKTDNGDNTYTVIIEGNQYDDIHTIVTGLSVNDTVKVLSPQNQMGQAFIYGKIL